MPKYPTQINPNGGDPVTEHLPPHATEWIIPEEVSQILKSLPEAQQQAVRAVLIGVSHQQLWQGPLPPPNLLKEYNEAFSNGAERIFREVQRQTTHRIELEKVVIPEQQRQSKRGQLFGLIVAISFLAAAFILIALGHGLYGTIIGSIDIVALVTVFVIGRREQMRYLKHINAF